MSREILFKAKRMDNGEWVEGYYINIIVGKTNIPCIIPHKNLFKILDNNMYQVELQTICQYTGLTDKNGKKIWEGDILSARLDDDYPEDVTYVEVTWNGFSWCTRESAEDDEMTEYDCSIFEVCGNVFDNPELLEQEGLTNERSFTKTMEF